MAIEKNDVPTRTRRTKKNDAAQVAAIAEENATTLDFAETESPVEEPAESAPKKRGPKKGSTRKPSTKKTADSAKNSKKTAEKK